MKLMKFICLICLPNFLFMAGAAESVRLEKKIETLAKDYSRLDIFSGTILVAKNGKTLYAGAYGDANKDHKIPNRPDTKYNIGSIGKTFTAVSVMQLMEAGKLKLSDPLSKFLPDYPFPEKDKITIHHLLNHSSGLGNYMAHKNYQSQMPTLRQIGDVLPLIFDEKPEFPAGERFSYSNSGMVVLGAIIEKVSGISYADYIRQFIFQPLEMRDSGIVQEDEVLSNRSIGYTKALNGAYLSNVITILPAFSDGGLRTTAGDLLKFDQALNGTKLLSVESKKTMFTPTGPLPIYAYGWESKAAYGHPYVGHNGGAPGINAEFRRYTSDGYTLIVLSNYSHGAGDLADKIEAAIFNQKYAAASEADAIFARGNDLMETGHEKEALQAFTKNRLINPPHLLSLYLAARIRILGEMEQEIALEDLGRYIQYAPQNAEPSIAAAWWRKGLAYEQLKRTPEAISAYQQALKSDPTFRQAQEGLEKMSAKKP